MPSNLSQMMGGMGGLGGNSAGANSARTAPTVDNRPPEEKYATQLSQLEQMGFSNKQNNIAALVATGGNLNAAVDRLVGMM